MNAVLWIVAGLLAAAFLGAGSMKLIKGKEGLIQNPQMGWVEDFSSPAVRLIGSAEVLGAIGLILPAATGVATILTPLAATGLALTMAGAVVVHLRRHEPPVPPLVLGVLAVVVAVLRFGPYAF